MNYDKIRTDGSAERAIPFTYKVAEGAEIAFKLAEWIIVIAAFEFAFAKLGFITARVISIGLSVAMALYVGVLGSNIWWRAFDDPYNPKYRSVLGRFIVPLLSGALSLFLMYAVRKMVAAQ